MKIALVSVGNIGAQPGGDSEGSLLREAEGRIRGWFGGTVMRSAGIAIPSGSFDARRGQYSSVAFLLALKRERFGDADRVIGLTECDLYIPMLTFVFGQAQLGGRVALVSLARLRGEFYGAAPDEELLRQRMNKEIGHELGHSFGLIHCPERTCLMSLATGIQDVDRKGETFCHACERRLAEEIPGSNEVINESEMANSGRR